MSISQQPTIGQRLLQERKKHSWSQQMLADKLGTTVLNINRWEHDKTLPQPYYREKLCEVFGKSHDELFGTPEEKHAPIWNIPHLRNLYFTGREETLTRLHDALTTTTKKAVAITQPHAISGLGGIGKTQTAVEYAYRYSDEYQAILWARADSHESLVSELVSLASVLDLPEKQEADQRKVVAAVMRWLQHAHGWLLIFDNADDLEMVSEFLPTRGAGHTLLTTRSQATGKYIKGIELDKMGRQEGALLLLRRAKLLSEDATLQQATEAKRRDAETICEVLDGLPLALDQAAAYIEENECSLSDYLDLYQTRRATLLKRRGTFSKRDYPKPVATTWLLSFEKVEQADPAAADLLRVCAFLHPDAIPEEILTEGAAVLGPHLQQVAREPLLLNEVIHLLRSYSLIKRDAEAKLLNLHRLVQVVLQDRLSEVERHTWAEQAILAVNAAFPSVEYSTLPKCERLLSQALTAAQLIEQYQTISAQAGRLLHETATYLWERARYQEAEQLYQRALRIREQQSGPEHLNVAQSLNGLADLYREQGKYAEAEPLYQQALRIREQQLGPEHPDIAQSLNGLALLYFKQGRYTEAEPLHQRALRIREQQLGPEHPDTASSFNNLAMLYHEQGKYAEAETLYQRALRIWEQQLGPEHPDMAHPLYGLADLYREQGKYGEAEPLYQRALRLREQSLGIEHPETAETLHDLAEFQEQQGHGQQALALYQRALAIRQQVFGPEHPKTRATQQRLMALRQSVSPEALAPPQDDTSPQQSEQNS